MREMRDSGIEWIKQIPTGWSTTRGKNILQLMKRPPEADDEVITCFRDGEVTLRRNRREEGFTFSDKEIGYQGIKKGDLVIHGMDGFAGAIGISDSDGKGSPVLVVCTTKENARYLMYYLRTLAMQDVFLALATGIRERSCDLRWNKIADLLFPVPELNEQCRIVDYLDRKCSQIDAIIARQQEVIEKLKAYKLSIITEAVTKGLNPDVPMKDSGVEWIGEIPEHWEIRRIGSFARVTSSKRIFEESYVDEGVPFYRSKEITDLSKGLHVQTEIFIPEEVFEQVNEASPAPKCGDILLTSIGTIGNTWISDGRKFYYKDGNITQIEANDSFDSAYVEYCFSSNVVLEQYTRLAMGSTLLALTIIKIKKILVAFPPLDEQRKIVQYLKLKCSSIDAAIKNKENLITKLVDYKKSLIYEVVTGKKEV